MIPGIVLVEEAINGILSDISKQRIDTGINLIKKNIVDFLILSGGVRKRKGHKYFIGNYFSLAEIMKKYAISKGLKKSKIILEDLSEDTVGQLIFIKQGVLDPRGIKNAIIISHDYHIQKIIIEKDFIFDKNYSISFLQIPTTIKKNNLKSIQMFHKTFNNIDFGDDLKVLNALLKNHNMYNQDPKFYIQEFKKMKEKNSK